MKFSLRNLALAAACLMAGATFAQDATVAPTVKNAWHYEFKATQGDCRFGTGVNGAVYYNDKKAGKVMKVTAAGASEYATVEGLGTGVTADDAGNLLVNTSFPNAASSTNMVIIKTDGTQVPITLTLPDNLEAARVDQIGRIVGDMTSSEGAFVFLGLNLVQKAVLIQIKECKQVTDALSYYVSEEFNAPVINTSAILQPQASFAEMADLGDDAVNQFAARNRSTKLVYYHNPDGDFVPMGAVTGSNTQEGFDVFLLGDVMYQIVPTKVAANYESNFAIAAEDGTILYNDALPTAGNGGQSFGSFAARKVSDKKVEVYQWFASGDVCRAALYTVTLPQTSTKGVFAYDLNAVKGDNGVYNVTFKANGDAAEALLVLTNAADENDVVTVSLGDVVKGENTFTYDAKNLKENVQYNWAIELHGYKIEADQIENICNVGAVDDPALAPTGNGRAGVVTFTDPQSPAFGYTIVALCKNSGFDVYDQNFNKLNTDHLYWRNAVMGGEKANTSSPMRGAARGNAAYFASWGDAAHGVVALEFNPATKSFDAPYSVFEGEMDGTGLIKYNGVGIGSGTPSVAFVGKGADQKMFTFDEDLLGNQLACYNIGEAKTITTAPADWGYKSLLANTNVGMFGLEKGLFVSQTRGNGMESGTPGLAYIDLNEEVLWRTADMEDTDPAFLPSATGGVCVNPAGDLIAVTTYTGIEVYLLSWDGDKPVLEKYKTITFPESSGLYSALVFDAANNMYVIRQAYGLSRVTMAEEEPVVTTAAKADNFISAASGVNDITIENAANGEAVYYNLNGVRVNSENLVPGVYVKSQNGKAVKVVIK